MSWGADAVQGMGSGSTQAGGNSFSPNMTAAMGKDASMGDLYQAVKKDIAANNENRVDLPTPQPGVPLQVAQQTSQQQQYRPMQLGGGMQAPPVITGFNL